MKPILNIPIIILIFTLLWIELTILFIPICILKIITKKDYERKWMVNWAVKILKKTGIKIDA